MNNFYKIPLQILNIILFIVLPLNSLSGQNIQGVVLDSITKEPISGVNIHTKDKKTGTTTNKKGKFYLNSFSHNVDTDTIHFSHVGYSTKQIPYSKLKTTDFTVFLLESVKNVDEVKITLQYTRNSQTIRYKKLASLKDGLYSFGAIIVDSNIYVIGGNSSYHSNEVLKAFALYGDDFLKKHKANFSWQNYSDNMYKYNILTDEWTSSGIKFRKRAYHNVNHYNNKLIVIGGKRLSANRKYELLDETIEIFDIKSGIKTQDSTNPHQCINFASVVYDNNLIVLGGSTKLKSDGSKEYSKKAHLLNLQTGYWYELNDMPKAKETKGILINNKIYLIGGFSKSPLDEIETYNINTGEWNTESSLFYPVERPAITYHKGIIYVFENGIIQTFNVATKNIRTYSLDLPLLYSELFVANNNLLLLGGCIENEFSSSPSPYLYSIDLEEFK